MEKNESYLNFLDVWHPVMLYLFIATAAIAVIILVVYIIRYNSAPDSKTKFDIAGEKEVKSLSLSNYVLAVAIFFYVNTTYPETISISPIWMFVRFFIGLCIATLHAYVAYLIFTYYWPSPLEARMKKLRYTPRINPKTGNRMKLLSEAEEDAYLDEGMQAEEDAFSVDYDVWIDQETGETHIEKYKGHLSAFQCDRCGFQTLKLKKEEVLKPATDHEDGQIQKEYKCGYCGRIKRKTQTLTAKINTSPSSPSKLDSNPLIPETIEAITIQINSTKGDHQMFEFQNIEQAKHFLDEFGYNKLS